jgi:hypothetical protein
LLPALGNAPMLNLSLSSPTRDSNLSKSNISGRVLLIRRCPSMVRWSICRWEK